MSSEFALEPGVTNGVMNEFLKLGSKRIDENIVGVDTKFLSPRTLTSHDGQSLLDEYRELMMDQLKILAEGLDGPLAFRILRRTAPLLEAALYIEPSFLASWPLWFNMRKVAELSLFKWARWTNIVSDPRKEHIEISVEIQQDVARLLLLSRCTAFANWQARLHLSRHQSIQVMNWWPLICRPVQEDVEMEKSIAAYMARNKWNTVGGFLGQYIEPLAQMSQSDSPENVPLLVPIRLDAYVGSPWPVADPPQTLESVGQRFDEGGDPPYFQFALHETNHEVAQAARPYSELLRGRYGCEIEDLLIAAYALFQTAFESFQAIRRELGKPPTAEAYFEMIQVSGYYWVSRAKLHGPKNFLGGLPVWLEDHQLSDESFEHALQAFCGETNHIDLQTLFFIPGAKLAGDWYLVDLAKISESLHKLILSALPTGSLSEVTRTFEDQVHGALGSAKGEALRQPWARRQKVTKVGEYGTDIDASVVVGDVLIAVDCFGQRWDLETLEADFRRLRNRETSVREKLEKWDSRMKDLASGASTISPTLEEVGIRSILPVVVTSSAEFLHDPEGPNWLSNSIPRALTVPELLDVIKTSDLSTARGLIAVKN